MDFSFFGADQEQVVLELVEVEAHTSGKPVEEGFLFVFDEFFVGVNDQFELDDLFGFQFVLHEGPVGDSTIRGNGVEAQGLVGIVTLPVNLPHRVCVLSSSNSRLVNGFIVALQSNIEHHYCTIITTYC